VNSVQIDVVPTKEYIKPKAIITVDGTKIGDPSRETVPIKPAVPVSFDGSASTGKNLTYQWDFGDEKGNKQASAKYLYGRNDYFPVAVLRVTDELGLSNDTYALLDLPFPGGNPIQQIWFAIRDFFARLLYIL